MIKQISFNETGRTRYFYLNLEINGKEVELSISLEQTEIDETITNWDILGEHNLSTKEIEEIENYLDELNFSEADCLI